MRPTYRVLSACLLALCVMAACTEAPEPTAPAARSTAALQEGLTVLSATDVALSAAYKKGDVVILFEGVRGQLAPDMYQQEDPGATRYEVDTRFTADSGRLFFIQRGGDGWVDPSWLEDLSRENDAPGTSVSNELLFTLAAEVHPLLAREVEAQVGAARASALAPVIEALAAVSAQAPETYAAMVAHRDVYGDGYGLTAIEPVAYGTPPDLNPNIVPGSGVGPSATGEVAYGSDMGGEDVADRAMGTGYYYISVYDKSTAVIARHSATRLYKWNGAWATVADSCNHGGCPTGSTAGEATASFKCSLDYTVAIVDYKPDWSLMTCNQTGYDAFSNDGHNCHDDTRVQMANFVYGNGKNKNPGNRFWCKDDDDTDISSWPGDQSGSPTCNSNSESGYNHKHDMCRTQGISGWNAAGSCYCDATCTTYGDCCLDGPI